MARALAQDGLEVVVTYTHDEAAARAAREAVDAEGLPIALERCDAGSSAEVAALFARIAPVDIVVHAAGFTRDGLLLLMSDRDFDDVLAVHLRGGFLASRQALPAMLARRWGRIVYLISPTALLGRRGQHSASACQAALQHGNLLRRARQPLAVRQTTDARPLGGHRGAAADAAMLYCVLLSCAVLSCAVLC